MKRISSTMTNTLYKILAPFTLLRAGKEKETRRWGTCFNNYIGSYYFLTCAQCQTLFWPIHNALGRSSTVTPFYDEKTDCTMSASGSFMQPINRWVRIIRIWSQSSSQCWMLTMFSCSSFIVSILFKPLGKGNSKARFKARGNRLHFLEQRMVLMCVQGLVELLAVISTDTLLYLILYKGNPRPKVLGYLFNVTQSL